MNHLLIQAFLDSISVDLKRIARRTHGELSHEDLRQEAYFYICDFCEQYKRYPGPKNSEDKHWLLARINNHFVKWADHDFRRSVRIDSLENDDGEFSNLELPADKSSDPLVQLLFKEQSSHLAGLLKRSYSEAKAYVIAFGKFDSDKARLSSFLWVTVNTLDDRCSRAITMVKQQRSLFDDTEVIDDAFNPMPGHEKLKGNRFAVAKQLPLRFLN